MKLTEKEIQNLYKFTRDHYVYWYDLQSELVDHLANDIEQIWEKEPQLSFEKARDQSFKKFGVCGFMDVIDERRASLSKRYRKMVWQEFFTFLTLPKVALTLSFIWAVSYLLQHLNFNREWTLVAVVLVSIYPFVHRYKTSKAIKKREKQTNKKWYFEEIITNFGDFGSAMTLPFQTIYIFSNNNFKNSMLTEYSFLFATGFVIFTLFVYIATQIIPKKVNAIIAKKYPDYKLV